jgi:hypothetical protein
LKQFGRRIAAAVLLAASIADVTLAQTELSNGRWALAPYACDGELFTRPDTPLLVTNMTLRWFSFNCEVVSSYLVRQTRFLQAKCNSEGKVTEIPVMLEPRGDRLRVGWNRERIQEMVRCHGFGP